MPFNLATLGYRQPGSSFKPFTLAEALMTGEYGPDSIIDSAPQDFIVPNSRGREHFIVHNFGNTYSGPITLAEATAISDNSVYAQVGIHVGTARIAHLAQQMGIRSPLSHNYAMILGGLKQGVSALDMAHAYETFATGGVKVYNHVLGDPGGGPVGIHALLCPSCPFKRLVNHPTYQRILPATVAQSIRTILEGVVSSGGTAPLAAIPGVLVAGKTGTTSNYVDAWFVGWTPQMTTAVWVGYPDRAIPMSTAYGGKPVEGGTFPAIIWHNFMTQALQILAAEHPATGATTTTVAPITGTPGAGAAATPTTGTAPASAVTPAGGGAAGPATGTGTPAAGTGHTGTPPAGGGTAGGTGATPGATTGGTTGGTGGTTGATGGTGGTTGGTGGTTGGTGGTGGTTGGTGGTGGAGVGGGSG
jgi:penicillin-binding protein 1A